MSNYIEPMRDDQRVLMQIDEGSVRADADAARQIAARHEEAYGDVWQTSTAPMTGEESHA